MKVSLKKQVQDYYCAQKLSSEGLENLLSLEKSTCPPSPPRWRGRLGLLATAAVFCLALIYSFQAGPKAFSTQAVVQEVLAQHLKAEEKLYAAQSFPKLAQHLFELSFTLQPVEVQQLPQLSLQGGTYCSLQGIKAVRIRLRDQNGQGYTAYEVEDLPVFDKVGEGNYPAGMHHRVTIYRKDGVLVAVAGPPETHSEDPF